MRVQQAIGSLKRTRYYGWRIAWALGVTQTVGYGVLYYAFSAFIGPMEAELGWTRAQTTGAFSVALLLASLAALPVGRLVDRYGARPLMTVGSLGGAGLLLLWSSVERLTALYLVQAATGLVMAAVLYEVAFTVVAVWFRQERAQAMLVITVMAGFASTIFIPLTTFLIEWLGWREALRMLALILALLTVPLHALVLRRHPRDVGLEPDGYPPESEDHSRPPEQNVRPRDALRALPFWWLSAAFALDRFVLVAVAAHNLPLLLERGYTLPQAAAAAGSIGFWQVLGRLLFAPATRRIALGPLTSATFACHTLALGVLLFVTGPLGLWVFAALLGIGNGASTLARAALVAERYGSAHYGSISGSMTTLITLTATAAPLSVGALRDLTGRYDPALWGLAMMSLVAAYLVTRAR